GALCQALHRCAVRTVLALKSSWSKQPRPRTGRTLAPAPLALSRPQIDALQEVLEKLKTERLPSIEKKLGSVASCDAGEPCAVRKGARIGRLCSCPRGTACNFYILKCL
uniref:Cocaine- and amphetamine-regulated transcript protein n=1 Tax=Chrysemys picta bellii TaxID=8478 RepID=A0A8C3HE82_CHRPI